MIYYEPLPEEIFPGYELELGINGVWRPYTWPVNREPEEVLYEDFRTPYLLPEQVKRFGWVDEGGGTSFYRTGNLHLFRAHVIFEEEVKSCPLLISRAGHTLFMGECKSINEFKLIQKWLKL